MDTASTLTGLLAAAGYAGRCPKISEYNSASPAEQRAIIARWNEITEVAAKGAWHWPNCREPDESIYAKSCLNRVLGSQINTRPRKDDEPRGFNEENLNRKPLQSDDWGL